MLPLVMLLLGLTVMFILVRAFMGPSDGAVQPRSDTGDESSWVPSILLMSNTSSNDGAEEAQHDHGTPSVHDSIGHDAFVADSAHTHIDIGHSHSGGHDAGGHDGG